MKARSITIAIPLFNEVQGVAELIRKTIHLPLRKEIIIINDGSTDKKTVALLLKIKKQYPEIHLITNQHNKGKAASIQKALQLSRSDYFVILDGDSELDPNDIPKLYHQLITSKAQFINGTRIIREKIKLASLSNRLSRFAKKITSLLIYTLYGKKIKDPLSGLKLFYTNDFKNYIFSSKKFGLETELIGEAINRHYKIDEVDVSYYPRTYKEGKKIRLVDGFEIITCLFSKLQLMGFFKKSPLLLTGFAFLVWLISFSMYSLPSTASPTTDTIPNTFTAVNIIYNKRLDLTNFKPYFLKRQIVSYVAMEDGKGNLYAKTPVINSILAAPFIYVFDKKYTIQGVTVDDFLHKDFESYYQLIGKQYGSLLASLSSILVFLILYGLFHKRFLAFFWTLAYALGTSVYSTASQGNWQHAPSLLLITLAYYCLFRFFKKNRLQLLVFSSFLLSVATLIRISNIIFFLSIWFIFVIHRPYRKYIRYSLFVFLLPLILWNIFLQIVPIPGGYNAEIIQSLRSLSLPHTVKVGASLLLSPNAGLLIFSPLYIFGLLGMGSIVYGFLKNKTHRFNPTTVFLFTSSLSFLGLFLFNSVWWAWEGGYSWGPRLLTEGAPFLIFLGAYFYHSFKAGLLKKTFMFIFFILFMYSFFVQILGVYAYETDWQSKYFAGNDSFVTAWYRNPSIIEFYLKRRLFHTVMIVKKDNRIAIEKHYYRFNLDLYKPFFLIEKIRYYIK